MRTPVRTPVRTPPARTRRASTAPAVKHAGASLATSLPRQLQAFATAVLGGVGTATDVAFTLAQSRIHRPGTKAAVAKGAALLRDLRQAAGLPLELILRLTAVLAFESQGRRDRSEAPDRRKAR